MSNISDNWTGYFINYLLPEDNPNHEYVHHKPTNVDWKDDLAQNIYLEADSPIDVGFLWSYKIWRLYKNPESEAKETLPEPIPIVVGKYHYGNFEGLEPRKQNLVLFCYYREKLGDPVELKPYQTLRNPLKKQGAREKMATKRRYFAESYIMQRAKEIDVLTAQILTDGHPLKESAIEAGAQNLDLANGIKTFFQEFSIEMFNYRRTGDDAIIQAIASLMAESNPTQNAWLKENILIDLNPDNSFVLVPAGAIISQIFQGAIAPVTQMQINQKAAEVE